MGYACRTSSSKRPATRGISSSYPLRVLLATVLTLTACGTPSPSADLTRVCHDKALVLMRTALTRDGNFDSLPRLPDRSLGIPECKGLSTQTLDALASELQTDLAPELLRAATRAAQSQQ